MSKPVQQQLTGACGHHFSAPVYRTANVTLDPSLKAAIFAGTFNVVECPDCGRQTYADVPFLYHDMAAELAVWVYPRAAASQEPTIRARIRRASVILTASVGEPLRPDSQPTDELLFGLESLVELLGGR